MKRIQTLTTKRTLAVVMVAVSLGHQSALLKTPSNTALAQQAGRWGQLQFIGPDTIADIAAHAAPTVVNIVANTSASRDQAARMGKSGGRDDNRKKRYYGMDLLPDAEALKLTGSGVIISSDGYVLTSFHVVENANSVTVTLQDGRSYEGTVTAHDRFSDLAVIKINGRDLPVVSFGTADQMRVGDWVIAIGNQFGLGHTVTQGLVSGLGREAKGFEKSFGARTGAVRFIQTDAPINPGSSGGPLLNLKGEVVGINTFIRDDAQNIGFAIPANIAKDVADKLTRSGEIAHPYIGIVMKEPESGRAAPGDGVEVTEVKFHSPASSAGIVPGDVILEIGQKPASTSNDISQAVASCRIGDSIKLKVRHGNSDKDMVVRVERLPDEAD